MNRDDGETSAALPPRELYTPAKKMRAALVPNLFAKFTGLANEHGAANLGQGFPSFGSPAFLKEAVSEAIVGDVFAETGKPDGLGNQYTRPGGEPGLAATIAKVYGPRFGRTLDPMTEVVTTVGAQEGIFTTLFAWTDPGDEVVVLTPCFDAVLKTCETLGLNVKPVCVQSSGSTLARRTAGWELDFDSLERAVTSSTRVLMLNTPSSPLGKVFSKEELARIAELVLRFPSLLVISDEVYERSVYEGAEHVHFASLPSMFDRTMTLFSAGKTFSCTGWRVGYIVAPKPLASALLASHAALNFCVPTPLQKATSSAFAAAEREDYFTWLSRMMQGKRDFLVTVLEEVGLKPIVPDGGYFVVCDATRILEAAGISVECDAATALEQRPDVQACEWMTKNVGVTAIPVSPFYLPSDRHRANRLIRFAFCKDEATMSLAAQRLRKWHSSLGQQAA